eukprot:759462-Hanusia_phi.AAC.3
MLSAARPIDSAQTSKVTEKPQAQGSESGSEYFFLLHDHGQVKRASRWKIRKYFEDRGIKMKDLPLAFVVYEWEIRQWGCSRAGGSNFLLPWIFEDVALLGLKPH